MHHDPTANALPTVPAQPLLPDEAERLRLRVTALSRWDNEGGAGRGTLPAGPVVGSAPVDDPTSTDAEAVQLHIRVIALENPGIALLTQAPVAQLEPAREMAAYISPRPGFTPLQLTLRAAVEMRSLVDHARPFPELAGSLIMQLPELEMDPDDHDLLVQVLAGRARRSD